MTLTFQAMWPITDPERPTHWLIAEAIDDLPMLAARAHAELSGPLTWSIRPSWAVPGSGRVTETVLICEAPAERMAERGYWKEAV